MKTTKTTQMFLPPLKQKPHGGRTQPPGAHSVFCREPAGRRRPPRAVRSPGSPALSPRRRRTAVSATIRNRVKHSEIRRLSNKNSKRERGAKGKQGARRGERRAGAGAVRGARGAAGRTCSVTGREPGHPNEGCQPARVAGSLCRCRAVGGREAGQPDLPEGPLGLEYQTPWFADLPGFCFNIPETI